MQLKNIFIGEYVSIKSAMRAIDTNGFETAVVVDKRNVLRGTITAGDIRRALSSGHDVNSRVSSIINKHPIKIQSKLSKKAVLKSIASQVKKKTKFFDKYHILRIPVVAKNGRVVDIAIYDIEEKKLSYLSNKKFSKAKSFTKNGSRRVLVVGGAGYLGSVLCAMLLKKGYAVRVLDILLFGDESLSEIRNNPKFELIPGDVRDINLLASILKDVDAVIHLAAVVGDPAGSRNPKDTIATNYLATMNLAQACKYYQINRFSFASTCSVYGVGGDILDEDSPLNPVSLYARSKIESERGILKLVDENFRPAIFRMGTLYGLSPRMRFDLVVNIFAKMATLERKITIFGGEQWRPLLHVQDAARAYLLWLQTPLDKVPSLVYNIGSHKQNYQIKKLGQIVKRSLPKTKVDFQKPEKVLGKKDLRDYKISFTRAEKELKFKAINTVEKAIKKISRALKNGKIPDPSNDIYYN